MTMVSQLLKNESTTRTPWHRICPCPSNSKMRIHFVFHLKCWSILNEKRNEFSNKLFCVSETSELARAQETRKREASGLFVEYCTHPLFIVYICEWIKRASENGFGDNIEIISTVALHLQNCLTNAIPISITKHAFKEKFTESVQELSPKPILRA